MENYLNNFYFKEYEKLKDEQKARISFRDQMIYISLGVIGATFSFTLQYNNYLIILLILPFICFILGWTYLINDIKISEIGNYIQNKLIPNMIMTEASPIDSWENFHKKAPLRLKIKIIQLIIDISMFCGSAFISIILYFTLNDISTISIIISSIEIILIIFLSYLFISSSPLINKFS